MRATVGREASLRRPSLIAFFRWSGLLPVTVALSPGFALAQHQQSARSVVQIECRFANGESAGASGFVWLQPTYVVTALHAVVGCSGLQVYSEVTQKKVPATVKTASLEADLALLELGRDLGLPPLRAASAPPNLDQEHYVWGYPHNIPTMQSNPIRFSHTLQATPSVLQDLFGKGSRFFRDSVAPQGYPQLQTKILRVGSTIRPGHSGAPILDTKGIVVGIADGGLKGGIAGINWGIPASVYLPGLPSSSDRIPGQASVQVGLYSARRAAAERVVTAGPTTARGQRTLELSWRATLSEILELVPDDEREDYLELIAEAKEETGHDLSEWTIEVYEDYRGGATLAAPKGVSLTYDPNTGMLKARTGGGHAEMIVQIVESDTWEAARAAEQRYDSLIAGGEAWQPDPEYTGENESSPASGYASSDTHRIQVDAEGHVRAEMYATLEIDDYDFLGTAVIVRDYPDLSAEEKVQYFLMVICTWLADFAIQ